MTFLTHEEQQNDKLSFHLSINEQKNAANGIKHINLYKKYAAAISLNHMA